VYNMLKAVNPEFSIRIAHDRLPRLTSQGGACHVGPASAAAGARERSFAQRRKGYLDAPRTHRAGLFRDFLERDFSADAAGYGHDLSCPWRRNP
jgi:hypothetical protein